MAVVATTFATPRRTTQRSINHQTKISGKRILLAGATQRVAAFVNTDVKAKGKTVRRLSHGISPLKSSYIIDVIKATCVDTISHPMNRQ